MTTLRPLVWLVCAAPSFFVASCGGGSDDATGTGSTTASSTSVSGGSTSSSSSSSSSTGTGAGGGCSGTQVDCGGCVDLMTDPSSCGTCGHDCQGGACLAGACQPVVLATSPAALCIAEHGDSVYWTSTATVMKVAKAGGMPVMLTTPTNAQSPGIAADDTSVYWSTLGAGTVSAVPTAGGTSTPLASGVSYPYAVTIDAANVYWSGGTPNGYLMKVPKTGGMPSTIFTMPANGFANRIAVDATRLYWVDQQGGLVMQVPLTGGTAVTIANSSSPSGIAVDGTNVYWTSAGAGTVMSAPLGGGAPVTLASGQTNANGIAVDGTNLYWTNAPSNAGAVMTMPIAGGAPVALATGQQDPGPIVVDAKAVYWANLGTIMKVAK